MFEAMYLTPQGYINYLA